jgi:hypothetical protein
LYVNIRNTFDVVGNDLNSSDLNMENIDLMEQNITENIQKIPSQN